MDDAARLVSELQDKLAGLDGKVAAYQRDLLAEFHKHMSECLKEYPDHVSSEVSRAIAESMSTGLYPALSPPNRSTPGSPAIDRAAWDGRKSPPPILRHTSGTPKEMPRDSHAREKEFQGLFIPTYLPLLESTDRALQSPPMSPPPTSGGRVLALSTDNVNRVDDSKQTVAQDHAVRPSTARSLTDRSSSSVESSGSDSKFRRSALRRSSSSAKGSPRRVRFEFEGEEVFPASSSPKAHAFTLDAESGAEPQPEAETPANATEDESTAYTGTSLLDVEGEEDLHPRPKKVSSTQRLQALSRCPLDEGTTWRLVSPDLEEPPKMNGEKQPDSSSDLPTKVDSQVTLRANGTGHVPANREPGPPLEESAIYDDDTLASDEEFLSMPPRRKSSSPTAAHPFTRPPNAAASEPNGHDAADDDGLDPLFDFDDEVGATTSQPPKSEKYLPESESSDEDSTPARLRQTAREEQQHQRANEALSPPSSSAVRIPPVSPSTALFSHSIGSYMGRSVTAAPIKDPKLYDEIAGMEDVPFFVGSIHDLTEVEAANLGSLTRASSSVLRAAQSGAAPRSFTERLALEDEMERRRAAASGRGGGGDEV